MPTTYELNLDILNKLMGTYLDIVNLPGGGIGLLPGIKLFLDKGTGAVRDHYDSGNSRRVMTINNIDQLHIYDGSIDFLGHIHKKIKSALGADGVARVYVGGATDGAYTTIASALAALPAAGGVVEILPGYTETITASIVIPNDYIAIICPTCDAVITDGDATGITMIDLNGTDRGTIYGVKLVGLGAGKASIGISSGVATYPDWNIIDRCWFHDCNYGIFFNNARASYNLIDGCRFSGHATWAIYLYYANYYNTIRDCFASSGIFTGGFLYAHRSNDYLRIEGCRVISCGGIGFNLSPSSRGSTSQELVRCLAYGGTIGYHLDSRIAPATSRLRLRSCHAINNSSHGFYFRADADPVVSDIILSDCRAVDNSSGNPNVSSGYYIYYCDRVSLVNCRGYGAEQKYGVEIAVSNKSEIRGGVWSPNGTASWLDNGTDTIIDARDD